jgi:DNA helicase-2/ATP-dependent DNA helicase PcrA
MLKNEWITYEQYLNTVDPKEELIAEIYKKYQKTLIESNSLDFDDLLLCVKLLFEKDKNTLKKWDDKFQYILVDEAQDTNQIQFDIIKLLSGKNWNVTFIWDDFQSIYGWRWAVMNNFLNISDKWKNIETFKLEINYRSRPHIVEAWNHIIANNKKQYAKNVVAHRKWDDKIRLFVFNDEIDEAINIVNLIKKYKEEKGNNRADFVILYRTNAQSQPFEQILITDWIPYKVWW